MFVLVLICVHTFPIFSWKLGCYKEREILIHLSQSYTNHTSAGFPGAKGRPEEPAHAWLIERNVFVVGLKLWPSETLHPSQQSNLGPVRTCRTLLDGH